MVNSLRNSLLTATTTTSGCSNSVRLSTTMRSKRQARRFAPCSLGSRLSAKTLRHIAKQGLGKSRGRSLYCGRPLCLYGGRFVPDSGKSRTRLSHLKSVPCLQLLLLKFCVDYPSLCKSNLWDCSGNRLILGRLVRFLYQRHDCRSIE